MNKKEYLAFHEHFCGEMAHITLKKNADYSGNGDDPFRNFRHIGNLIGDLAGNQAGTGPLDIVAVGFLTRMSDKFSRIGTFINKGELLVKDESVTDSLVDLANYCALFAGYLQEKSDTQRDVANKTNV